MFPVFILLIFTTAQAFVPLRQKTASPLQQFQHTNISSHNASFSPTSPNIGKISRHVDGEPGCKNCISKRPPYMSEMEYTMRVEEFKAKILQALRLNEPPKINRPKNFTIPPPLLKKFQEAQRQQKERENQEVQSTSEVIMFGRQLPLPNRRKRTNDGKKVKFDFHISYKVFTTTVKSADLWLHLTRPTVPSKAAATLVIRDINTKNVLKKPYVITKELKYNQKEWISVDVKNLVNLWKRRAFSNGRSLRDLDKNSTCTLEIACINCGDAPDGAIGSSNSNKPFIEVNMVTVTPRKKRSVDCRPGIKTCCRQKLQISFNDIGWNWILIPDGFKMNYCTGSCYGHILPSFTHSSFLQKVSLWKKRKDMAPCCSPTKFSALSILFFDPYENINQENIPNMTVEECGCS